MQRINNGEITERALSRALGISQPQLHHVLNGKRRLQLQLADRLLVYFAIQISDLLEPVSGVWLFSQSPVCGFVRPGGLPPPKRKQPGVARERTSFNPTKLKTG